MSRAKRTQSTPVSKVMNPVQIALGWKQMLAEDEALTMSKIAGNVGISRTRVTQIMNLLYLPEEVVAYVSSLTAKEDLRHFSERTLRRILTMKGTLARLAAFRQMQRLDPALVSDESQIVP